jgi:hypothetical protein
MSFVDRSGVRRRAVTVICANVLCGNPFLTRADQPGRFCTRRYAYLARRTRRILTCCSCGTTIERPPARLRSKNHLYFCTRQCKDKGQRLASGLAALHPPHYGTGNAYRKTFLAAVPNVRCARCAYSEFPEAVEIHHLDHNRRNNAPDNLAPLCANCHRGLHAGRWTWPV